MSVTSAPTATLAGAAASHHREQGETATIVAVTVNEADCTPRTPTNQSPTASGVGALAGVTVTDSAPDAVRDA